MTKTIEGVPEFITRADYLHLIESVGFDANRLKSLRFASDGIYAEALPVDPATGSRLVDRDELVVETVYIPVKDEDGAA